MALRKQPDRHVKKKRTIEMQENLDIAKKKRKLEEPKAKDFDIVGNLLCNYGMTGENLVRDIFSYMDVSSLQGGHLVCKTWNHFLINDIQLWMKILRKTEPYFEFSSQLFNEDFADVAKKKISKEYFDILEKNEDVCSQIIIKKFKRIQMIHMILQDVIQDCPFYKVFQKEFIGEKLAEEIQLQTDTAVKAKRPKKLFEAIASLKECRDAEKYQTQKCKNLSWQSNQDVHRTLQDFYQDNYNISYWMLERIKKNLKTCEEQLLIGIKSTLHES